MSVRAFCWLCTDEIKTTLQAFEEVAAKLFLFIGRSCVKLEMASTNKSHKPLVSSSRGASRYTQRLRESFISPWPRASRAWRQSMQEGEQPVLAGPPSLPPSPAILLQAQL